MPKQNWKKEFELIWKLGAIKERWLNFIKSQKELSYKQGVDTKFSDIDFKTTREAIRREAIKETLGKIEEYKKEAETKGWSGRIIASEEILNKLKKSIRNKL